MISDRVSQIKELIFKREKIYIYPNRFGFLYLGVIIIMILVGATYTNNLIFLLGFFLFSVFVSSMVQTHGNIKDVKVTITDIEDSHLGDKAKVTISVQNLSSRSKQSLRVVPRSKELKPEVPGKIDIVYGKESVRSFFYLYPSERGHKSIQDLTLYTVYPMGLFYSWKYSRVEADYYVYPKLQDFERKPPFVPIEELPKKSNAKNQSDHRDDFREHRVHQKGESHHHIDWKVFAKTKEKMVKTFESPAGAIQSFDLSKVRNLQLEERLSQLSYWVKQATFRNTVFELRLGEASVAAGQGPMHAKNCQRQLAIYGVSKDAS